MREDPNRVDWASWLRSRPDEIQHPERVIVQLGDGWYCQLCSRRVSAGDRGEHHRRHMLDLDAYQTGERNTPLGPKPDSIRRAKDREDRRRLELEQAQAFGRDPYLYAVVKVEKVASNKSDGQRLHPIFDNERRRPILRRRLRHPKTESLAIVRELLEQGVLLEAIADRLQVSDNYARRLIRQIEAEGGLK